MIVQAVRLMQSIWICIYQYSSKRNLVQDQNFLWADIAELVAFATENIFYFSHKHW